MCKEETLRPQWTRWWAERLPLFSNPSTRWCIIGPARSRSRNSRASRFKTRYTPMYSLESTEDHPKSWTGARDCRRSSARSTKHSWRGKWVLKGKCFWATSMSNKLRTWSWRNTSINSRPTDLTQKRLLGLPQVTSCSRGVPQFTEETTSTKAPPIRKPKQPPSNSWCHCRKGRSP